MNLYFIKFCCVSHLVTSDSATTWTVARQSPVSMGFSRQEYCSGLPFPSTGDLPDPGIEPRSSTLQVDYLLFFSADRLFIITK